ncbi:MAG TPA: peptidoglycan DD-metalloendopeptidase family protein [Polyangia bacterium]
MSPRRKRRSAEVRNSLRLFGLLAVLAGVNVYVFFFNHGTAPRDVLKPSSTVKAAEGKAGTLKEATQQATAELSAAATAKMAMPAADGAPAVAAKKAKPPQVLSVAPTPASKGKGGLAATSPPKEVPGGSPGLDDEGSLNPEKKIGDAETLGQILVREGFEGDAPKVVAALSKLFDAKLIRGGQSYLVHADEAGEPESFEYHPNAVTRYVVSRGASGAWVATRIDQPIETKVVTVAGNIDSSLYESVQKAQEGSALAGLLVEVLAWDVNFYTDTHPGDHWKVMVEKQYLGGQFYRYGHLLAAEYGGRVGTVRTFYWKSNHANAEGHYFDEKGQAISKTLLKTPLRFVRISSKFDRHRFHPILHVEKAHLGIDYAAPVGTPVWASAAGKVVECEMKRGSGNTVVLAHPNGLTTRYYHLSRFARGMKAGKVVKQKDVIGFVGTTGLSTGPHLHFSVTKNGAFVDPSKVQVNRDAPVSEPGAYQAAIRPRIAALRALEPTALARN